MAVLAYIVMTTSEKDDATLLDDQEAMLGAKEIDNPLADNLGLGVLVGKWVAPARLLNDPEYVRWVPMLGLLPIHVFDTETIFIPTTDEDA